eukprot:1401522-Ditylum_brightwellii.AAC.1
MLELKMNQEGSTMTFEDSTAAIMMANANKPNGRTRHINISYSTVQEWVKKGDIKLAYIRSIANQLDSFNKALV